MQRIRSERNKAQAITEEIFREAYEFEEVKKPPLKKVLVEYCKCTKETVYEFFPFAKWIQEYKFKEYLLGDIIAGVTVAVMHIPHGLAYAPLGRVDPVVGFYMALFPVVIYMFLGTSRHLSIGTFAVLCAMVGEIVKHYESDDSYGPSGSATNTTDQNATSTKVQPETPTYQNIEIATAVCLMVGVWEAGLGILRLGFLTVIMSESLVSGFTTGAAFHVLSYQLKNLFGVRVALFSGIFKLIYIYIDFFKKIKTVNLITMSISIVCISILLFFNEFLKPLIQKRFPRNKIPIPIELIMIVTGILVSHYAELKQKYNVAVVGYIPRGFPKPAPPPAEVIRWVIIDSLMIALVALAVNLSLARIFAKKGFYMVSSNQEFVAYGMANIFSSFFLCLPSSASLSRSSIQFVVGGKTQLASLFSICLIILMLLFAGPLFGPVPYCVLSSIVVVTLKGLLMQMGDVCQIWRENTWDGIVWVGTFLAVVILDLDIGLIVGIVLSIVAILYNSFKFEITVLGRVPNTSIFLNLQYYKSAQPVPNILILHVAGAVNFTNSSRFEKVVLDHFNGLLNSVSNNQYLILSMLAVSTIDPAAVNSIRHINEYLVNSKCDLYVTDCNVQVYRTFEICNLYKDFPKDKILATVPDAVEYLTTGG